MPEAQPTAAGVASAALAATAAAQRRIAATERSASASVVDQFETEIRIAAMPCQVVPPSQQVPSAWTAATTSRVNASMASASGVVPRHRPAAQTGPGPD